MFDSFANITNTDLETTSLNFLFTYIHTTTYFSNIGVHEKRLDGHLMLVPVSISSSTQWKNRNDHICAKMFLFYMHQKVYIKSGNKSTFHPSIHLFDIQIGLHNYCKCLMWNFLIIFQAYDGIKFTSIVWRGEKRRPGQHLCEFQHNEISSRKISWLNSNRRRLTLFKNHLLHAFLSPICHNHLIFLLPTLLLLILHIGARKNNCSQFYALDVFIIQKKSFIEKSTNQRTHYAPQLFLVLPPIYFDLRARVNDSSYFFYLPPFKKTTLVTSSRISMSMIELWILWSWTTTTISIMFQLYCVLA